MEKQCGVLVPQINIETILRLYITFTVFSDNISALKDVWIIGDLFVSSVQATLYHMRSEAILDKRNPPYLFEYYNVRTYYTNPKSDVRSPLARLVNAVVKGLNANTKLPKYILILPDKDLFQQKIANFSSDGIKLILKRLISYVIEEINKAFSIRKDMIRNRRPGGISTALEPRVIWVSMISRSAARLKDSQVNRAYQCTSLFNNILIDLVFRDKFSHIINLGMVRNYANFERNGWLSSAGKENLWKEVNVVIRKFDRLKTNLRPDSGECSEDRRR